MEAESNSEYVNFILRDRHFNISLKELSKYPNCLLSKMISKDWNSSKDKVLTIDSNPDLFENIAYFINYGMLPRNRDGKVLANEDELKAIECDADFYNLIELTIEVQKAFNSKKGCKLGDKNEVTVVMRNCDLITTLYSMRAKFCASGDLTNYMANKSIYGRSTIIDLDLNELLSIAEPSSFGKGAETIYDPTVRSSLEIKAEKLNKNTVDNLASMFDVRDLRVGKMSTLLIKPYKLVIYRPGDHFLEHRDTVRGPNHVGTVVLILNSEFEGGDFCVKHGNCTKKFNKPLTYVAIYGDCIHWIEPIISGVRITLVFDILLDVDGNNRSNYYWQDGLVDRRLQMDFEKLLFEKDIDIVDKVPSQVPPELIPQLIKLFESFKSVVIPLTHLYPLNQIEDIQLKGNDQFLYESITTSLNETKYSIVVVPIIVHLYYNYEEENKNIESFQIITRDSKSKIETKVFGKTLLLNSNDFKCVLKEEEIDYTGNESTGNEFRYLTTVILITDVDQLIIEDRESEYNSDSENDN